MNICVLHVPLIVCISHHPQQLSSPPALSCCSPVMTRTRPSTQSIPRKMKHNLTSQTTLPITEQTILPIVSPERKIECCCPERCTIAGRWVGKTTFYKHSRVTRDSHDPTRTIVLPRRRRARKQVNKLYLNATITCIEIQWYFTVQGSKSCRWSLWWGIWARRSYF